MKYWGIFKKDYLLDVETSKDEAISTGLDYMFDGIDEVHVKPISKEEYDKYIEECY